MLRHVLLTPDRLGGWSRLTCDITTRCACNAIACITPAEKMADGAEAIWAVRREVRTIAAARGRAESKQTVFAQPQSRELH